MKDKITKSIKIAIIVYLIVVVISFLWGGIYTEMYLEGLGFSISNLLLAFIGAFFAAIPFFILTFIITFVVYWIKKRKQPTNS